MTHGWAIFGLVGLLLGSFVNVLIHRLPRMLAQDTPTNAYNLSRPASHCPHCQTPLRWFHNIPLLSFVALKGRCAHCHAPISWRYPIIELSTCMIWLLCAWHWPRSENAACWATLGTALLALAVIDWETTLLPDAITQPLLWIGVCASLNGWIDTSLTQSVTGAMVGYLSLWSVATLFQCLTHKEGMGAGDFKLLAALGAWLGPWMLWPLVLLASVAGVMVGLALKSRAGLREGGYLPFGPFLAAAGAMLAWWGPSVLTLLPVA
jgi:leader peptidase (prepilin peptidase)/N-methyltransferase